jgi:hypothetical protein
VALPITLEVERMMNLIRNFGWEKTKEEMIGDQMHVTIKHKVETKPTPTPT